MNACFSNCTHLFWRDSLPRWSWHRLIEIGFIMIWALCKTKLEISSINIRLSNNYQPRCILQSKMTKNKPKEMRIGIQITSRKVSEVPLIIETQDKKLIRLINLSKKSGDLPWVKVIIKISLLNYLLIFINLTSIHLKSRPLLIMTYLKENFRVL